MILGISGVAGAGKDTVADMLVKKGWVKVSLADPLKRICKDVFAFSDEQLWGPSECRNIPDERYPRWSTYGKLLPHTVIHKSLTPRRALQLCGTEFGRACYPNVWINYALRMAKEILDGGYVYTPQSGLVSEYGHPNAPKLPYIGVVIPDVRFRNEMDAILAAGGKLVRIVRSVAGLSGDAGQHVSETEQAKVPDEFFDQILRNDFSLDALQSQVDVMCTALV